MASVPFGTKTPLTKIPFLPRHLIKNCGRLIPMSTQYISRWTRDTNVEWPICTSTSSLLLLRPTVTRDLCIVYSKSWHSRRASGKVPDRGFLPRTLSPDAHASMFFVVCLQTGADRSARRAHASLSDTLSTSDMMICRYRQKSTCNVNRFFLPVFGRRRFVYITGVLT